MNSPFDYSNTFILDKQYLAECYDQSSKSGGSLRAYSRAIVIIAVAILLAGFTNIETYTAAFILIIGIVDAANVHYHKAWWLARQAWGSSYNSVVTLTVNEEGIATQSSHVNQKILWPDIKQVQLTEKGLLVHHAKGKDYLSNSCLTDSSIEYILSCTDSSL